MPMFAVGLTEHETPFTFGSAIPPLTFVWSVNNKDVVKLQNVLYKVSTSAILLVSCSSYKELCIKTLVNRYRMFNLIIC